MSAMKKMYQILGLVGVVIWLVAIAARELGLDLPAVLSFAVGVAPNFGVVWLLMGLYESYGPIIIKRESTRKGRYIAAAVVIALLVLSEIIHMVFLGAGFDVGDLLASVVAMVPLLIMNQAKRGPTQA